MCGIAGFVSSGSFRNLAETKWLESFRESFQAIRDPALEHVALGRALEALAARFDDLMRFSTHLAIVTDPKARASATGLADHLDRLEKALSSGQAEDRERHNLLLESLRDYAWQVRHEVLENVDRTMALLPPAVAPKDLNLDTHFVAFGLEMVLENLDRLEVRGRDSSGLGVHLVLPAAASERSLRDGLAQSFVERAAIENAGDGAVRVFALPDGRTVYQFLYKVANLIGRLGDNGTLLRERIRKDALLWSLAGSIERLIVLGHTRWASNGVISVPNCHPVDAALVGERETGADVGALFVLNGDVDNYGKLVASTVTARGGAIPAPISTDSKIIPLVFRFDTAPDAPPNAPPNAPLDSVPRSSAGRLHAQDITSPSSAALEERFAATIRRLEGSMAVVMMHPHAIDSLFLAQRGSGQSLFASATPDGKILASEIYGICARTRRACALADPDELGIGVRLCAVDTTDATRNRPLADKRPAAGQENGSPNHTLAAASGEPTREQLIARRFASGETFPLSPEPIQIFSRDIFRRGFDYFLEKEIHESADTVRRTLRGRYQVVDGRTLRFDGGPESPWDPLATRLRDSTRPAVRKIIVTGQGTAAVAAMGVAWLIDRAVASAKLTVYAQKASELSGDIGQHKLDDTILIAISQSGTTTDTNRTVDLARASGAWVHAIVNRRNSPLVRKSNSHLFTSDGRDIEMAVASTKAFYAQIAAGKLMALFFGQALGGLSETKLREEVRALESLPGNIEKVLAQRAQIRECARAVAPRHRYWAVVGSGPNMIAAQEIRIKLSELCYKSIPCDYTEDKKHIDLSTEPLTIVVGNDLPGLVAQDTAKEVAIFKAHSGRPIVIASVGETCFDSYADRVLRVPSIGAGLDFVLATVAGHLFGLEAARAIDEARPAVRELSSKLAEPPCDATFGALKSGLAALLDRIAVGEMDSALAARHAGELARVVVELQSVVGPVIPDPLRERGLQILKTISEETSRPIDTIRHQAKTVTVGISRPQRAISPLVVDALQRLDFPVQALMDPDRELLITLSSMIAGVSGGVKYALDGVLRDHGGDAQYRIHALRKSGAWSKIASRYDSPNLASGIKRKALRLGRAVFGLGHDPADPLIVVPTFDGRTNDGSGVLLLHVTVVPQATLPQKRETLREVGYYDAIIDILSDAYPPEEVERVLESLSPFDLLFAPRDELERICRSKGQSPVSTRLPLSV